MTGSRDLAQRVERLEAGTNAGNELDIDPNIEISEEELDRLAEEAARMLAGGEVDPDFDFDFEGETRTE